MKRTNSILLAGLLLASFSGASASAATAVIGDDYNFPNTGSGFALGEGINSGIYAPGDPTNTRLTGTAKDGLRYLKLAGGRADTTFTTTGDKFDVTRDASQTATVSLSDGVGAYDFASALGTLGASPSNKSKYEVRITMRNRGGGGGTARFSFAIGSVPGNANQWEFGVQLYRANSADTFYQITKRIDASAGLAGVDLNAPMTQTAAGTWDTEIPLLIEVTDAGMETTTYNSRVRISMDNGSTWFYDTDTDPDLPDADPGDPAPNKWRMNNLGRYFIWDIAGTSATYDDFSVTWISGPEPSVNRVWGGGGANDNWSTGANWLSGIAPSTGDSLIFKGTTRQANINDLTDLLVPSVTFSNGGFSLSGNPLTVSSAIESSGGINTFVQDLLWASTSAKTWRIASGGELVLNGVTSIEVGGDNNIVGGGTLRLKGTMNIGQSTLANPAFEVNEGKHIIDAGSFYSRGGYRIGSLNTATTDAETVITNGASFNLIVSGANLRVGDSTVPTTSKLTIDNSYVTMAGGILCIPQAAGATGEVSQVGGTVNGARVSFSEGGAGKGTYTLKNGTLAPYEVRENTSGGESAIYFDNGTLQVPYDATNAFMSGIDIAEIQAGGLTIDAFVDATIGQAFSGVGSLTKQGAAAVTLNGANTYAGNTLVQAGRLMLRTGRTLQTVQVSDYAEFGVVMHSQTANSAVNNTLSLASGTKLVFDMASYSNPSNPFLRVTNLSAVSFVAIELKKSGVGLSEGTIPLLDYEGPIGGGVNNFLLGGLTLPAGVSGYLVDNTTDTRIDLVITGVPGLRWTGAYSTLWDYGTANWFDKQTSTEAYFSDYSQTEFLDGATTGTVDISGIVSPASIVISNNVLPYQFLGGALTAPYFKKYGTGSIYRDSFDADLLGTGGVELNQGSLIVSNGTFSVLLTDAGTGTGTLLKQGSGDLLMNTANTSYDGDVRIEEGTLKLGNADALGTANGKTVITNNATLDLNDLVPGAEPIIVSGAGVAGQGAIIDSTTGTAVMANLRDVTMAGDTTFGASGRWDLRIRSGTGPGPGLQGNGFNLTKVGIGHVSLASQRNLDPEVFWNMNLGDVFILEGQLTFAEALNPGNPAKGVFISPGAILATYNLSLTNPIMRTIYINNSEIDPTGANVEATNVFGGAIDITGTATFNVLNGAKMVVNGPLTGSGALNITAATSSGTVILNGAGSFPGDTTVSSGVLAGNGSVAGNLVMNGGTFAPGDGVGIFSVGGNATLASATVMELDRNMVPNSDRLAATGSISISGTLQVVLVSNPQPGDVYQLFNKGVSVVPSLPDISGLPGDMTWDTSSLSVDGTLKVNGTPSSPTIDSVTQSGGMFTFSGTGGVEGSTYWVITSPVVTTPLSTWTPVATNVFGPGGTFSFTTNIVGSDPAAFYGIKIP